MTEQPRFGGPAAATVAGLRALGAEPGSRVAVVAADLPHATAAVRELLTVGRLADRVDGVVAMDAAGTTQPLLAIYDTTALSAAARRAEAAGPLAGTSMRALLASTRAVPRAAARRPVRRHRHPGGCRAPRHPARSRAEPCLSPRTLEEWVVELAAALDLPADSADIALLLDLARDAAHTVARPAAPVTTFLVGLAAGRAGGRPGDVATAADTVRDLLAAP